MLINWCKIHINYYILTSHHCICAVHMHSHTHWGVITAYTITGAKSKTLWYTKYIYIWLWCVTDYEQVLFLLPFSSFIFSMVLSHEIRISLVTIRQNISVLFTFIMVLQILLVKWQLTIRSRRSSMSLMYLPNSANELAVTRAKNSFISRHNILALSRITLFDPYDFWRAYTAHSPKHTTNWEHQ